MRGEDEPLPRANRVDDASNLSDVIRGHRVSCRLLPCCRAPACVKLVEDPLDPILAGDRIVVDEPELGRALESQPGSDLPAQERRRPAERSCARFAGLCVAEHRIQDAGHLQIGADLDARQRDEADPGIVNLPGEQRRELASDLIGDAIGTGTLGHGKFWCRAGLRAQRALRRVSPEPSA